MSQLQLPARAYQHIPSTSLKLARTIADLAGEDNIQSAHFVLNTFLSLNKSFDFLAKHPEVQITQDILLYKIPY